MHGTYIKITTSLTDYVLQDYIHKVPVLPALHSSYVSRAIAREQHRSLFHSAKHIDLRARLVISAFDR